MNISELARMYNETDFNSSNYVDVNIKYKLYIIVPIMWSTIILLGLLGNGTIIYIILKKRLYKDSCTNCYIINVAIADLCFTLICVPVTMTAYIYKEWMFGAFMCSFQMLLMFSSVQAACLTLTAMTVDRYLAVLYPFKSIEYRTTKLALMTNIIIWIVSFTLSFPYFLYYKQTNELNEPTYCAADFPIFTIDMPGINHNVLTINMEIVLTLYTVIISYALPLTTIIFCYLRMIMRIYGKSNDQRILEESKSFSSAINGDHAGSGLRINVNRPVRVSLDNFGRTRHSSTSSNHYKPNKRGGSVPMESLLLNTSRENGHGNKYQPKGDLNKSMEEFLDELDEMNSLPDESNPVVENDAAARRVQRKSVRTNSEKSEVRWGSTEEGEGEVVTRKKIIESAPKEEKIKYQRRSARESEGSEAAARPFRLRAHRYNRTNSQCNQRNSYSSTRAMSGSVTGGRVSNMSNIEAIRKQKQKILLLIATVSTVFAMTWFPAHFIQMWRVIFKTTFPYNDAMYIIKFMAHTLSYSNSFLNPLIYVFMGSRFRNHIHSEFSYLYELFYSRCRRRRSPKPADRSMGSTNSNIFNRINSSMDSYSSARNGGHVRSVTTAPRYAYYDADSLTLVGLNNNIRSSIR